MADCPVEMHDSTGAVSGNLTIKDGKSVNIGGNTTLHCNNGNVTASQTNPKAVVANTGGTNPPSGGVIRHPVLVHGPEGLRLKG
jgi:hypothetical protein